MVKCAHIGKLTYNDIPSHLHITVYTQGVERFANYKGYGASLEFAGECSDPAEVRYYVLHPPPPQDKVMYELCRLLNKLQHMGAKIPESIYDNIPSPPITHAIYTIFAGEFSHCAMKLGVCRIKSLSP